MMALRWLAIPCPCSALLSASASAFLTTRILSASPRACRRHLLALSGVDVVHCGLDLLVGNDIGDQHVDDLVSEGGHVGVEFLLDGGSDAGLRREYLIERHAGNVAQNHLLDVRLDLRDRIGELVERVVYALGANPILH